MRILFVDDEENVLEGIENRLRRYRRRWEMDFSVGPHQALEMLEEKKYDAIVSDMRMPEIDGAVLLMRVRDKYSGMLRIVLTGQTEKDQILKSLSVAHRVLNKPCDAILLESAIADAIGLQQLLSNQKVRHSIDNISELPTLPKLHEELTEKIKTNDYSLEEITSIVEQEPVISSRILQLVNSSYYGLVREVVSIRDAVSYLGIDCLRSLVLNLELFSKISTKQLAPSYSLEKMQIHSLRSAQLSKRIINQPLWADLVYSSALLHEVGLLIMAYTMPEEYENTWQEFISSDDSLVCVQKKMLGFSYADVGAYLLSLWDLPFSIIEIVATHHQPSMLGDTEFGPSGAVHIASLLTKDDQEQKASIDMKYIKALGLEDKLAEWSLILKEDI